MKIAENELKTIKGGIKWGVVGLAVAGVAIFAIGFVDGFTRTLKCNNKK